MEIKKLDWSFYTNNTNLVEVLDKEQGVWDTTSKTRGYGIAVISVNGLKFGIPLRSVMKHDDGFLTTLHSRKALDYSKAFKIPNDEFIRIKEKTFFITQQFDDYVNNYIKAIRSGDKNKIKKFKYSTLCNYHTELGI